jgi:hypothetical protein
MRQRFDTIVHILLLRSIFRAISRRPFARDRNLPVRVWAKACSIPTSIDSPTVRVDYPQTLQLLYSGAHLSLESSVLSSAKIQKAVMGRFRFSSFFGLSGFSRTGTSGDAITSTLFPHGMKAD